MNLSSAGLAAIKRHEGLRLQAYVDAAGVWTIGYGTTRVNGEPVTAGMAITEAQAEQYLRDDVRYFEARVNELVRVPLTQGQFDALVSLAYNVGEHALAGSTLLRKLNAGDYEGAASEFDRWVFAGGRRLAGLESRRAAERAMFTSQAADGAITGATPPPPATQPVEPPASSHPDYPSIGEEPTMPLPAPALIALGAELLKVIPWGKKNAERIEEVAPVLVNIAKTVAPAGSNEQAAVEAVMRDKETQAQFVAATAVRWSDVAPFLEHDSRERAAARTFAQAVTAGDGWRAIGAGMLIGVLSLTIVVGGGLLFWSMLESPQLDPGQKGLILGALLTAFTSAISFWFGSSAQSRAKDATISEQARR